MSGECDQCGEDALECYCEAWYTRENNGWIDVEKELPPQDGLYEVSNDVKSISAQGCLFYDGIGFTYLSAYRPVKFWRYYMIPLRPSIKRYGKLQNPVTPPSSTVTTLKK